MDFKEVLFDETKVGMSMLDITDELFYNSAEHSGVDTRLTEIKKINPTTYIFRITLDYWRLNISHKYKLHGEMRCTVKTYKGILFDNMNSIEATDALASFIREILVKMVDFYQSMDENKSDIFPLPSDEYILTLGRNLPNNPI